MYCRLKLESLHCIEYTSIIKMKLHILITSFMFDGNCAVARRLAEYNSGCKSDIKTIHLLNRLMGAHTDNSIIIWSILMGPSCPRWIMPAAGPHTAQWRWRGAACCACRVKCHRWCLKLAEGEWESFPWREACSIELSTILQHFIHLVSRKKTKLKCLKMAWKVLFRQCSMIFFTNRM